MTALISFACVNIGQICQIEKGLTFNMARHAFSTTICLSNGISMETLSKMLGHSDIGATQIYGKITDLKISEVLLHSPSNSGNLRFGTLGYFCSLFIVVVISNPYFLFTNHFSVTCQLYAVYPNLCEVDIVILLI